MEISRYKNSFLGNYKCNHTNVIFSSSFFLNFKPVSLRKFSELYNGFQTVTFLTSIGFCACSSASLFLCSTRGKS